jgi:hypothetical protein
MEIGQLKEFILWCKANKVKTFSKDGICFEFSDLAFIENLHEEPVPVKETFLDSQKTMVDTEEVSEKDEDELLFWSSSK